MPGAWRMPHPVPRWTRVQKSSFHYDWSMENAAPRAQLASCPSIFLYRSIWALKLKSELYQYNFRWRAEKWKEYCTCSAAKRRNGKSTFSSMVAKRKNGKSLFSSSSKEEKRKKYFFSSKEERRKEYFFSSKSEKREKYFFSTVANQRSRKSTFPVAKRRSEKSNFSVAKRRNGKSTFSVAKQRSTLEHCLLPLIWFLCC